MTSRVIVESPFAGGFSNVKYSRRCIRDCLDRGESPFASHLLYTQKGVLDDSIPEDRRRGIDAAVGWLQVADCVVVYCDLGMTEGMAKGIARAALLGKQIKFRWIDGDQREVTAEATDGERLPKNVLWGQARVTPLDVDQLSGG